MGKHEREDVRIAETIMDDLLNGKPVDSGRRRHRLYPYAEIMTAKIRTEFPRILKSTHIGNTYINVAGDLRLDFPNKKSIFLELKFLELGTGTRANIGQDSLTKLSLFKEPGLLHWSDFRKQQGHEQKVQALLNRYRSFPQRVLKLSGKQGIYARARHLRELTINGNPDAKVIMNSIAEMDRKEKIDYIEHLESLEQDYENIKRFVFLIIAGVHTYNSMIKQWDVGYRQIVEMLREGYYVCYVYENRTVLIKNWSEAMKTVLDKQIYIWFSKGQTNVMIGFDDVSLKKIPILRVVFHWKNIAQGIMTPCLNIFDEKYLLENL